MGSPGGYRKAASAQLHEPTAGGELYAPLQNTQKIPKRKVKYTNADAKKNKQNKTHVLTRAHTIPQAHALLAASVLSWPSITAPTGAVKILFVLRPVVSLLLIEQT